MEQIAKIIELEKAEIGNVCVVFFNKYTNQILCNDLIKITFFNF